jgi:hypothetical protein
MNESQLGIKLLNPYQQNHYITNAGLVFHSVMIWSIEILSPGHWIMPVNEFTCQDIEIGRCLRLKVDLDFQFFRKLMHLTKYNNIHIFILKTH